MTTMTRIGWGVLLVLGLLAILMHPAFSPIPTIVGKQLPMPILLQLAVLSFLVLWRYTWFLTQWLSQCRAGHQHVRFTSADVTDLICTRLC